MLATTSGSRKSSAPAQIVGTERGAAFGHQLQHGVVGERAVLDAVSTGLDRVLDAAQRVTVSSDVLVVVMGDLDRRPQLVECELDGSRVLGLRRQQRTGGHDLDQVGAVGELPAHGGAHRVRSVGDVVHARVVTDRLGGDREQLAGEEHPWSGNLPGPHRVTHGHLDVVPAADVAHGRDARHHGAACGVRGVERDRRVRSRCRLRRVAGIGGLCQMDVTVDQAGEQPRSVQVDHVVVVRCAGRVADVGDAVAFEPDVGPPEVGVLGVVHVPTHQPAHGRHRRRSPIRT